MTSKRGLGWTLVVLAGVAVLAYARPLFSGQTFALRDNLLYSIPTRTYLAEALRAGRFPGWSDAVGLGVAFAANPVNGVLYPPTWLCALLPMPFGSDFLIALHVLWAGLGAALLARRVGADEQGGIFAGAALMTSGFVASAGIVVIELFTLAWTPWVAWGADRLACATNGRERGRAALVVAALLAMQLLSGEPVGLLTSALLALTIVVARSAERLRTVAWLGGAAMLGLALAAVLLVPALSLVAHSERAGGMTWDQATQWSMHPWRALEWVWPWIFGHSGADDGVAGMVTAVGGSGMDAAMSVTFYVGAPVLACAVLAARPRGQGLRALLALSLFYVVLALGRFTPIYAAWRAVVLPERIVRYPEKHLAGAVIVWAVLAGVGFTRLFDGPTRRRALPFLGIAVLLVVGALFTWNEPGARAGGFEAAAVAALFGFCVLARVSPGLARIAVPAAFAIVAVHLIAHDWSAQILVDDARVAARPALLAGLPLPSPAEPRPRIYRPRDLVPRVLGDRADGALAEHDSAIEDSAVPFGFAYMPGYDPTIPARLHVLSDAAAAAGAGTRLLGLYDVEYAILDQSTPVPPSMSVLTGAAGLELVRDANRRPRAFVAPRVRHAGDDAAMIDALIHGPIDPGQVLSTGADAAGDGRATPCQVSSPRPERVTVSCAGAPAGLAVLLDSWADGWTATVDGVAAPIERVDLLVRGVRVGAGDHQIVYEFHTPGLLLGGAISLGGLLVWCAAWWTWRRRDHDASATAPTPATRKR